MKIERQYPPDYYTAKLRIEELLKAEDDRLRRELATVLPGDTETTARLFTEYNERRNPIFEQLLQLEQRSLPTVVVSEVAIDSSPTKAGWYATLHCWDVQEGLFPGAHYWTGEEWLDRPGNASVSFFQTEPFESREEALRFATEHDPER